MSAIPIDPERIVAIIESQEPDNTGENAPETPESQMIAKHLIEFFQSEVDVGRLPRSLLPLQSGIGNVAKFVNFKKKNFHIQYQWFFSCL